MKPKEPSRTTAAGNRPPRQSFLKWLLLLLAGLLVFDLSRARAAPATKTTNHETSPKSSPREGYERKDASVGWVFGIIAMLAITGVGIHLLLIGYLRNRNATPAVRDEWQPLAMPAGGLVAPVDTFPRLQVSPPFDLAAFRAREEAHLNSYAWVNKASGKVHIPISVAMDLLIQKGLPVRKAGKSQSSDSTMSSYEFQVRRVEQQPGKGGERQ